MDRDDGEEELQEQTEVRELPPGTYTVDEQGRAHPAVEWQPILERIKWEQLDSLIESFSKRGTTEKLVNLGGMYALATITITAAAVLAYYRILEGQALAGFLGAAIGYLLSRAET